TDKIRVGEVLLQKGLITPQQLAEALQQQSTTHLKLGEVLIEQGSVTKRQLNRALNEQRWRNGAAALFLTLSAGFAIVPKVIAPEAVAIQPSQTTVGNKHEDLGGGNPLQQRSQFSTAALPRFTPPSAEQAFLTPLSANPSPSVASPLTGFCHPLNGVGYLSQGIRGTTHRGRMEYAYDLAAGIGTPVYAMRTGRVIGVQDRYPDTGGGADKISQFNYIMIEHDGGYRSAYLHLQQGFRNRVSIKSGDIVKTGQLIGYSGNSGWSSGPHLHVEVQKPGLPFGFTKTVPFAIAGTCSPSSIAQNIP
ncbi:MAG TPA: peptidoglycan DD-metalloendopeptidase family protein, partial [Stenomitos sp.]